MDGGKRSDWAVVEETSLEDEGGIKKKGIKINMHQLYLCIK